MKTKVKPTSNGTAAKLQPQDREAERALLGTLMASDQSAIYEVASIIQPESFFVVANGLVFQTMLDLSARGEPLDPVTIMAEMRKHGHADIGDGQHKAELYLSDMLQAASFSRHASSFARIVAEMATRRAMIDAASKVATLAWDEQEPLPEVAERAQALIFDSIQRRTRRGLNHISDGLPEYLAAIESRIENPVEVSGLATGLVDLDRLLNGLKAQELIIIAGRTGMGKTAEMIAMVDHMSVDHSKRGAFFSLEMSKEELTNRLIARRTGINTQDLARGSISGEQQERLYRAIGQVSQAPLFISDKPAMTPAEIRAECMRQQASTGLDYVMIDYLGLIAVPGSRSRYEQVSTAARFCKNLAKELEVPNVTSAQLNRAAEHASDKRPALANLRDSGEIEESADVVVLLYRDEYYNEDTVYPNRGENIIAKHRNGETGVVDLYWNGQTASYHNLERREPIGL